MIRVGIPCHGFVDWGGGIDFLRMVMSSLHHTGEALEFHLLCPSLGKAPRVKQLVRDPLRWFRSRFASSAGVEPSPARKRIEELARTVEPRVAIHDIHTGPAALAASARRLGLHVLIPSIKALPVEFRIPWVGYAYDFQHRYFPNFFSPEECAKRDLHFAEMSENARALVVNSHAVAEDVRKFFPGERARIFALPFCPAPQASWLAPATSAVAQRYDIRARYFIVCNQFWQHKGHDVAIEAFAAIAADHPDVLLVCTGDVHDPRAPEHSAKLLNQIERDRLGSRVRLLGMIPKDDQIALLSGAQALVQPTLFEGGPGGGAVYDAMSIGQRCLVSDIPVNREIDEPGVQFFASGDARALAGLMRKVLDEPGPVRPDADALLARGRARRAQCGRVLLQAIRHVL